MIIFDITDPLFSDKSKALQALYEVIDPELYVNIVDLGLVYNIALKDKNIEVEMTLSTPHCPMGESIVNGVKNVLEKTFPDAEVEVNLVWEPTWSMEKISEEGKRQLGL
ncbi:MAG: metal-sulfur cluster assembly factor [Bacteroidia bacterium]